MIQFWKDHGTKILGVAITVLSGIAAGSVVLPPPLNNYSVAITSWAVFINFVLGIVVTARGVGNTAAIAAAVSAASPAAKSIAVFLLAGAATLGLSSLTGCATTAYFNKAALTVGTLADTAVNTTNSLVQSRTISSTQAQAALNVTNEVEAAVSLANQAKLAGNLPTANAKIAAASGAIIALQTCLAKPSTQLTACIAGIGAP